MVRTVKLRFVLLGITLSVLISSACTEYDGVEDKAENSMEVAGSEIPKESSKLEILEERAWKPDANKLVIPIENYQVCITENEGIVDPKMVSIDRDEVAVYDRSRNSAVIYDHNLKINNIIDLNDNVTEEGVRDILLKGNKIYIAGGNNLYLYVDGIFAAKSVGSYSQLAFDEGSLYAFVASTSGKDWLLHRFGEDLQRQEELLSSSELFNDLIPSDFFHVVRESYLFDVVRGKVFLTHKFINRIFMGSIDKQNKETHQFADNDYLRDRSKINERGFKNGSTSMKYISYYIKYYNGYLYSVSYAEDGIYLNAYNIKGEYQNSYSIDAPQKVGLGFDILVKNDLLLIVYTGFPAGNKEETCLYVKKYRYQVK